MGVIMPIGAESEKLLERMAVGALDLDAVEACGQRVARAPGELPDQNTAGRVGDLLGLQGARGQDSSSSPISFSMNAWLLGVIPKRVTGCRTRCEMRATCQSWLKIRPLPGTLPG
jgi:hypothetical protein